MEAALTASQETISLQVLVELGVPGGRTGCRTVQEVVHVARSVAGSTRLRLAGIEGYEGVIDEGSWEATLAKVDAFLDRMVEALARVEGEGLFGNGVVLSAGGSVFFDRVAQRFSARRDVVRLVRPGCYLPHDHGKYRRLSPLDGRSSAGLRLQPALEVWASVVSCPEPGLAILNAGRRDVSFDAGLPVVVKRIGAGSTIAEELPEEWDVVRLMDQHAVVRVPEAAVVAPGDLIGLGISHPCTTFDKWSLIPVVDDDYRVIDCVITLF